MSLSFNIFSSYIQEGLVVLIHLCQSHAKWLWPRLVLQEHEVSFAHMVLPYRTIKHIQLPFFLKDSNINEYPEPFCETCGTEQEIWVCGTVSCGLSNESLCAHGNICLACPKLLIWRVLSCRMSKSFPCSPFLYHCGLEQPHVRIQWGDQTETSTWKAET